MWRCASRSRMVSWCAGCLPGPRWRVTPTIPRRSSADDSAVPPGDLSHCCLVRRARHPSVGGCHASARTAWPGDPCCLEVMRPLVDHVPGETRRAVDLTSLGVAFGATPSLRLIGLSGRELLGQVAARARAPSKISTLPGGNAGEVSGCVPAAGIPDLGLSEQICHRRVLKTGASWLGGTGAHAVSPGRCQVTHRSKGRSRSRCPAGRPPHARVRCRSREPHGFGPW
jgi:hypothetical protein